MFKAVVIYDRPLIFYNDLRNMPDKYLRYTQRSVLNIFDSK